MRTTLDLDEDLVRRALHETGARSKTELLEMGLRSLLEREARSRLKALYGKGPSLLGGHLKSGHSWTGQNRPFPEPGSARDGSEVYLAACC
jgi:hypothetical protein